MVRNQRRPAAKRIGVPQNFGIFYAAGMFFSVFFQSHDCHMISTGMAMMGQAIMSTAYHMCPSRDNFKFDATFIYIQFGIGIHKLLQSRNPDKKPSMHFIMLLLAFLMVVVMIGTVRIYIVLYTTINILVIFTIYIVVSIRALNVPYIQCNCINLVC